MRIAFILFTLILGIQAQAFATVNEYQEQRAEQFCQANPDYCK